MPMMRWMWWRWVSAVEVHMRDTNAFAWYMEQDPLLRSTVVVVLMLEGAPDWDRLVERLERLTRSLSRVPAEGGAAAAAVGHAPMGR